MTLRTAPAAADDIERHAERLEADRRGRGAKFLRAYRDTIDNIGRFPRMYPETEDGVPEFETRNALLERFEVRVIYLIRDAETVILAVTHARREPGIWHDRLPDAE